MKGNYFIRRCSLLPLILAWTTKPSFNDSSLQLAVLTISLINGLVRLLSTNHPWAHTRKTSASNRRVFLAASRYICENVIPKCPKIHCQKKKKSDHRICIGRLEGISSLQTIGVVKERTIWLWIHSMFLIDKTMHHLIAHQWIPFMDPWLFFSVVLQLCFCFSIFDLFELKQMW